MGRDFEHDGEVQIDMSKKFDIAIMNPPYDRNLHLKILEKVIPYAEETINISPIRWLKDPLAKYKKNSDYNKFKESIRDKIASIEEVKSDIFEVNTWTNLGILKCNSIGGFDTDVLMKEDFFTKKVLSRLFEMDTVNKHFGKRGECNFEKPFVKLSELHGNIGAKNMVEWITKDKARAMNTKKSSSTHTVNFETQKEADNFFYSLQTDFLKYINARVKLSMNVPWVLCPFMSDYTKPWDNKRFCDYFKITGYIDDEHAEPDSEWEEILNTMEKYK